MEGDQGARLGVLRGVEGHGVGRGARAEVGEQLVADGELLAEGLEVRVTLAERLAVPVDVAEDRAVDVAQADEPAMIIRVARRVDGHEAIGHDASAAVDGAVVDERTRAERVGEVDAVCVHQFAVVVTVDEIAIVGRGVATGVGLLDVASAGGVVAGDGEADHGVIRQGDGTLHEALAEGAPTDDHAAIPVLHGAGDDLAGRGRRFVDEDDEAAVLEVARGRGRGLLARRVATLGVDDQAAVAEELVGQVAGHVQVAAAVALKVEDEVLHALLTEPGEGLEKLLVRGVGEAVEADVARGGVGHVGGVEAVHGDLAADDLELDQLRAASALHLDAHLGSLGPTQTTHDVGRLHLNARDDRVVDHDNPVASRQPDALGGAAGDDLDDVERIGKHIELDADAVKPALERLVEVFRLLGVGVGRVGVELVEHAADGVLDEFLLVGLVHIEVFDRIERDGELACVLVRPLWLLGADVARHQQAADEEQGIYDCLSHNLFC